MLRSRRLVCSGPAGRAGSFVLIWFLMGLVGCAVAYAASSARHASAAPVRAARAPTASSAIESPNLAAAVRTVCPAGPPACQYAAIQTAVDAAQDGDLIKVSAGAYSDMHGRPAPPGYAGPSVITQVVYLTKTLTIRGGYTTTNGFADPPDPATNPTTLDAQGDGRVLFVAGLVSPTLEGLRITGGNATGLGGDLYASPSGGGVYVLTATAILDNNEIFANEAGDDGTGGGVTLFRSTAKLQGNSITANSAGQDGGGLYLWLSPAQLRDNTITANTAITFGGGLHMWYSPVVFEGNTISDNQAGYGGGMQVGGADQAIFQDNVLASNNAWVGGAVYMQYTGWIGPALFTHNTVLSNTAIWGGGLWLIYAPATFVENSIADNVASQRGGAVAGFSNDAIFERNTFVRNRTEGNGGAIQLDYGAPVLHGNTFAQNEALSGGALHLYSNQAILRENLVLSNTAESGAGIALWYSPVTLEGNLLTDNSAAGDGGALWLDQSDGRFSGNQILANRAGANGGAAYLQDSDPLLVNTIIADNVGGQSGSGLYVAGSAPRLLHSTLARNSGGDGTGIYLSPWESLPATAALTNTILAGQATGMYAAAGCTATLEATLWDNEVDWAGSGAIVTGTVNLWGNPLFVDPAASDYHIRPASPALNAGVDAGVATDVDGEPRPAGPGVDIGADELVAALSVTVEATPDPVAAGSTLTYGLQVTNEGYVWLSASITDVLPIQTDPGGTVTWTAQIAPGSVWMQTMAVTVAEGYSGPLVNILRASSQEGAAGVCTSTVAAEVPVAGLSAENSGPTLLGNPTTLAATVTAGSHLSYAWAFGSNAFGSGAVVTYTYPAPGTYIAVVTASNSVSALTATTVVTITAPASQIYLPVMLKGQ